MDTQKITIDQAYEPKQGFLAPFGKPGSVGQAIGEFMTIGRDPGCEVPVNDDFVSSRHARIERKTGGYVLRDLRSRNGSFLNGTQITEAVLTPGDRLRFGDSVFVFSEVADEPARLASKNPEWQAQLERLPAFAATQFPALITGPSGSGKELLARAVHQKSLRANGPFISINCSALSEHLIESELFGHVKGSFTSAINDRKGAFEAARGGTIFLDEIGDLPMILQPKLLRAIENQEIRPVGSDRTVEIDIRVVAATHKNIPLLIKNGLFREDLYYRLNVCAIHSPSLRDRREDFEELVYSFAKQFRVRFSFNAIEKLKEHTWPGNIRELKNTIARASAYFPGKNIQPEDLETIIEKRSHSDSFALPEAKTTTGATASVATGGSLMKEIEREMIVRRLRANKGNQRRTASDLGMPKSTLHDRIKAYGIDLVAIANECKED